MHIFIKILIFLIALTIALYLYLTLNLDHFSLSGFQNQTPVLNPSLLGLRFPVALKVVLQCLIKQ